MPALNSSKRSTSVSTEAPPHWQLSLDGARQRGTDKPPGDADKPGRSSSSSDSPCLSKAITPSESSVPALPGSASVSSDKGSYCDVNSICDTAARSASSPPLEETMPSKDKSHSPVALDTWTSHTRSPPVT